MNKGVVLPALCALYALGCPPREEHGATPSASEQGAAPSASAPVAAPAASSSAEAAPHASAAAPPTPTPNVVLAKENAAQPFLAWRPNGRAFAAGAGVKVSLYAVQGGEPRALPDHERPVVALIFSIKGDRLATVDKGGKVRVWDASAGSLLAELPDTLPGDANAIAFSPDGKLLAGAGSSAVVWNVDKKTKVCVTEEAWAFDLAFSADQATLVTTGNGAMTQWETATCKRKSDSFAPTGGTFGSWVSPFAKYVAAAATDGHGLRLYDGKTFQAIEQLATSAGCKDHVGPVRFSRDGEILLASGSHEWVRSFRLDSLKTIAAYDLPRMEDRTDVVMFDDGERLLIVRGGKGDLVSMVSKSVAYEMDLKGADTFDVSWDMKHLLGASKDTVHVWETATGKLVKSYSLPPP